MPSLTNCAHGVRLGDILRGSFFGAPDIDCTACCGDPTQCEPGDVYFAVAGAPIPDMALISTAVSRGARAVVCEQLVPVGVPVCVVDDVRRAYAQVCHALAGAPHQQLQMVGITGTSGKTVTSELVRSMLRAAGNRPAVINSLVTSHGVKDVRTAVTPSAPDFAKWLADSVVAGCDAGVVEVSSQVLAEHRIAGIAFDAVVLTNLRRDHLDLHNSPEAYRNCKRRIFRYLRNDGVAILNADDRYSRELIGELRCPMLTVGVNEPADLSAEVIERRLGEQTFLIKAGDEAVPIRTRIIGNQHIYRCLSAAALGLVWNIDLPTIIRGLEAVEFVPGNMQRIECGQPFGTFVHHAPNPESLATSLKALRPVTKGRVICVFSAGIDRDPSQRPLLGRVAERHADVRILTQDDYQAWSGDYAIAHDVMDGMHDQQEARLIPSRDKAVTWALEQARAGDSILIASHDPQHDVDAEFVKQLLYETPQSEPQQRVLRFPLGASLN